MRGTSKAPSARSKPTILKRLGTRFGILAALVALLAMAIPAGASADALGANSEFFEPEAPSYPVTLTEGSDGNVWFTDPANPAVLTGLKIGKVTPAGAVSLYSPAGPGGVPASLSGGAWGIADGPDGDIWFTEPLVNKVGHIDPAEPTTSLVEIELPKMSPEGSFKSLIAAGPDGNLWVTQGTNGLARITPGGEVTEYPTSTEGFKAGADVCSVTAGPDGNVWFGDCGTTKAVGKITPAGVVTEYSVGGGVGANMPSSIALGSDGRLWFPADNAADERIGAITTTGTPTYYKTPTTPEVASLSSVTAGPDGNIWAADTFGRNEEQKVTITGTEGTYQLCFESQCTGWTGTGSTTSAGKTITGVTTLTGKIAKGELVTGAGIPAGSTVSSCTPSNCESPTSIVMSKAATATAAGVSLSADLTTTGGTGASTNANVDEALGKLSTIGGASNVFVLSSGSNRLVSFTGKFERSDVPLLGCDGSKLTGGTCSVETTATAIANRLYRVEPAEGKVTAFSLKPATALQSSAKANTLAAGPGGNVWYTSTGLPPAIGKFGTGDPYPLTVTKTGAGAGTVQCDTGSGPEACVAEYLEGTEVSLTQSASPGSVFTGWGGACSGTGACEVTISAAKEVTANFALGFTLTVDRTSLSTGSGTVVSSPAGIECGATCAAGFETGKVVTLTASAATDSVFTSWSGCTKTIEGTGALGRKCTVEVKKAMTVKAKFTAVKAITASRDSESTGYGTISSTPGGISCGPACTSATAVFTEGSTVLLKAVPVAASSEFNSETGWTGCDSVNGEGKCVVVASAAKSVEAKFTAIPQNTLAFEKKGAGVGTVSSAPAGISCGPTCLSGEATFLKTKTVLLKAVPSVGSSFSSETGWSGCDSVTGEGKCSVTMTAAKSVTAEFK